MIYTKKDIFWGGILLALSDSIAAIMTDQFTWIRFVGMLIIGATLYAIEIPNYFYWLEKFTDNHFKGLKRKVLKSVAVVIFFNPLWIFRHYIFIYLLIGEFDLINLPLLKSASISYAFNVPISLIGNYLIQNKMPLKWRFIGSSVFSVIMILYYTMGQVWFK